MPPYWYNCLRTECRMVPTYSSLQYVQFQLLPIISCLKIVVERYIFLIICSLKFGPLVLTLKKKSFQCYSTAFMGPKGFCTYLISWMKGIFKRQKNICKYSNHSFTIPRCVVSVLEVSKHSLKFLVYLQISAAHTENQNLLVYRWSITVDGFSSS